MSDDSAYATGIRKYTRPLAGTGFDGIASGKPLVHKGIHMSYECEGCIRFRSIRPFAPWPLLTVSGITPESSFKPI